MVEKSQDVDVMLGFLEPPRNPLILDAKYLPSKIGGLPVSYKSQTNVSLIGMDKS